MNNCNLHKGYMRLYQNTGTIKLNGIYRAMIGRRDGQPVWIVDGVQIARQIYPEWIMGGNDQRYRFNPSGELWIDDRIGAEELEYTIRHEVLERSLMKGQGLSYDRAHNQSLALEKTLRDADEQRCRTAGRRLVRMAESGVLGPKAKAMDPEKLSRVYRVKWGRSEGATIWIVDGCMIRAELEPNFCFGDNGLMSEFIPRDEIWIDHSMSSVEAYFTVFAQKLEFGYLAKGSKQDRAYQLALIGQLEERDRQARLAAQHEDRLDPVRFGSREKGVKG